jgi:phosphonate transport system substrate-binding protein
MAARESEPLVRSARGAPRARSVPRVKAWIAASILLGSQPVITTAAGEPLVLLIQPILREEQTREAYAPLCDYLGKIARRECRISTAPNFLAYWEMIRRNQGFDLVLDAAHFTDYRVQKFGFRVLAKVPDHVSFSLVVPEGNLVLDPAELVGKTIATLGPPSMGAAHLNAIYPNPARQPAIIEVNSVEEGFELVAKRRVQAAILPTPLVAQQLARGAPLFTVMTTEPVPHAALSASPRLDPTLREQLRAALLNAEKTPEGRLMLKGINFERFENANAATYAGYSRVLKEYWGY